MTHLIAICFSGNEEGREAERKVGKEGGGR